jgi:hypothetical protein
MTAYYLCHGIDMIKVPFILCQPVEIVKILVKIREKVFA